MLLRPTHKNSGQILISLVITIPFFILMISAYLSLANSNFRLAKRDQLHTQSQLAADAGADYAIEQINANSGWTGTGGEVTLHNDSAIKTTYAVTVASNSSSSKTLTVTGRTYWPAGSGVAADNVVIKVDLGAISSGAYSIVSGEGGLYMSNSSKIVGGDVFINGEISLSNSSQIGLSTNPLNISVADQVCPKPPDATYPRVCNSGETTQPISISGTAHIYGTVKANNQTSGTAMSSPGLVAGLGVAPQALPSYDRAAQKAAVTTTTTGAAASCSNGSQTWQANTKITGNVSLSGSCQVTVRGNVWITGNFTMANSSKVIVADTLGSTRPNIMIDGVAGASFKNGAQLVSNASGNGFEVLTFWSNSSCSPDCAAVTGTDLYNSRNTVTISLDNTAQGPQTIFYSYWSRVQIRNSGQIGALVGQSIELSNTGTITFTSSSGVGNTFWVNSGYRRSYN